jgi:hypothetical protein
MQVAEKNVQQHQNRVIDELLDVVSGFDAWTVSYKLGQRLKAANLK